MKAVNAKFNAIAIQAAELERAGDRDEAAIVWRKAAAYSNQEQNREWCELRAEFCSSNRWWRAA